MIIFVFVCFPYEFKPASIDNSQIWDSIVTVEFHKNQHGRPKVSFEGASENYKQMHHVFYCLDMSIN